VEDLHMTLVGAGSWDFPVRQQLAMPGVRRRDLSDPDAPREHVLVKHPARGVDLGRPKVYVPQELLSDCHPTAEVSSHTADVMTVPELLDASPARTDLVACAVHTAGGRGFVNERGVEHQVPCATGLVFRTGRGGTVHLYLPGRTSCFACWEAWNRVHGYDSDDVDLTDDEHHRFYGPGGRDYHAPGLASDITLVTSLCAALCTSLLRAGTPTVVPPITLTWLTSGTRRAPGVFDSRPAAERILLRPQRGCRLPCARHRSRETARRGPVPLLRAED
jgi:hypothetical protein